MALSGGNINAALVTTMMLMTLAAFGFFALSTSSLLILISHTRRPLVPLLLLQYYHHHHDGLLILPSTLLALTSAVLLVIRATRRRRVFLVDFACYKPDECHRATREVLVRQAAVSGAFTEGSLTFMRKMLERSGIGQESYVPSSILNLPGMPSASDARVEVERAIYGCVDELLKRTGVSGKDIGVLVVNCSLYGPAPSLSSMVVSHYKLREDVKSYSLGGMGCSAGLISIDLAKRMLQVHPNTYALVVSTESMTLNGYFGNHRPMLVTNSIFRMGGAAILLSNRSADEARSKYQLLHTVRTHNGAHDQSYGCVMQEEDSDGFVGIALSKDLMAMAGEALKANITTLGPLVLPLSEKLHFLAVLLGRKLLRRLTYIKPYVPDFKLAFEHFCIHAGGRAVLDEMEKNMGLTDWHMEPSRMALWRYGNTSSSSLWYELSYTEAKRRVRKGDRVWQIAFGSGFKCNSAVWKALRTVPPAKENPWMDVIDGYPVAVPKVVAVLA